MKKIRNIYKLLLMISAAILPAVIHAQPPLGDENVLDNPVPFDGGVVLLIVIAIAYGWTRGNSKKKADSAR